MLYEVITQERFQFMQDIDIRGPGQACGGIEPVKGGFDIRHAVEKIKDEQIFGLFA